MEDLRNSYNVNKGNSNIGNFLGFIFLRRRTLIFILSALLISFVVFFPEIIGKYSSMWLNDLYSSFMTNNSISLEAWSTSMGTVFCIIVFYGLIKWINRY